MIRVWFAALGATLFAAGASAQDPAGVWQFRTDIKAKGCSISGQMAIEPEAPGKAPRSCRFFSIETCGPGDVEPAKMEQSCRVIQQGDFLLIRSEVVASLTDGVSRDLYMPDHFTVKPTEPDRMAGTWQDRLFSDDVEFWRVESAATS